MNVKKSISFGTLALALTFGGLAIGTTGCATTAGAKAEKGDTSKCGAGSCGAKTEKGDEKKCGAGSCGAKSEKGDDKKCGAGSCG